MLFLDVNIQEKMIGLGRSVKDESEVKPLFFHLT